MDIYKSVLTVAAFVLIIWGACGLLAFIVRAVRLYVWMRGVRKGARMAAREVIKHGQK